MGITYEEMERTVQEEYLAEYLNGELSIVERTGWIRVKIGCELHLTFAHMLARNCILIRGDFAFRSERIYDIEVFRKFVRENKERRVLKWKQLSKNIEK